MKTNHIESNTIFRENVGLPIKKKDGRFANKNKTVSISALKSAALKKKTKQTNTQSNKQQPQKFEEIQQRANRVIRIWSC